MGQYEKLSSIDIKLDKNQDNIISDIEKSKLQEKVDSLPSIKAELKRLDSEITQTTDGELQKEFYSKYLDLQILYNNTNDIKNKIVIQETIFELTDLYNDIKKQVSFDATNTRNDILNLNKDTQINTINKDVINIYILKLIESKNIDKLMELSKSEYGYLLSGYILEMKEIGINSNIIIEILKLSAGMDNGYYIFNNISKMLKDGIDILTIGRILEISSGRNNGYIAFKNIKKMKDNNIDIITIGKILKIASETRNGAKAFSCIEEMKDVGIDYNMVIEILKTSAKSDSGVHAFSSVKEMIKGGIDSTSIIEILEIAAGTEKGSVSFYYIKRLKDEGIDTKTIGEILKISSPKDKLCEPFLNIKDMKDVGIDDITITDILNKSIGDSFNGFTPLFIENYNNVKNVRGTILLGKDFERYKQYIKDQKSFNMFIEKVLINTSPNTSKSINDIYDFYEEKNEGHDEIIKGVKEEFKKYSTEELLSSLGNHSVNYSITFNLVLEELDLRMNGKSYFQFINENENLTDNAKVFLKGQTIAGLSSRGKVDKLNELLKEQGSFDIIKQIVNYKDGKFFTIDTYLGLMVGLQGIIKTNIELGKQIYLTYFTKDNINPKFKRALEITIGLDKLQLTSDGLKDLSDIEKENFNAVKDNFLLPNNEIFGKEVKDMVYIYGGNTQGGGIERYNSEINMYINKLGYRKSILKKGEKEIKGCITLEKDGVRVSFINYDEVDDIEKIFSEKNIVPIMIAFRGHNYFTSKMIVNLKELLIKNQHSIVVDGGCRNISAITGYREEGIRNQIVAYTDTGKGDSTYNYTANFISKYLKDPKQYKDKQITLKELASTTLSNGSYEKKFMKFPGDLIDIVLRIERGEMYYF